MIIMTAILINMDLFIFSGNCRVILAYCKYNKWQVIIFKLTVFCCLLLYLVLAAYFLTNSFIATQIPKENEEALKEFFFLYVFGLFTLYLEIFIKVSDLDGTSDFQYHYHFNYNEEEVEVSLVKNKKVTDDEPDKAS